MTQLLLVGVGGFLGSVLRYGMSILLQRITTTNLPAGTIFVNVVGCFLIGALGAIADTRTTFGFNARLFLFVGALGGFTTFSAFGSETLLLARDGHLLRAALNILIQVGAGLTAVWLGYSLTRS